MGADAVARIVGEKHAAHHTHAWAEFFTFEFFADDVVELAAERFVANGMRYHTPYDALNDMRNLEIPIKAGKRHGLYVAGGLVYTHSRSIPTSTTRARSRTS